MNKIIGSRKRDTTVEEDFVPPDLIHYEPLHSSDVRAVKTVVKRFRRSGVLDDEEALDDDYRGNHLAEESFHDAFAEALGSAQHEQELNPASWSPSMEKLLADEEAKTAEFFDNPFLDGYGEEPILSQGE